MNAHHNENGKISVVVKDICNDEPHKISEVICLGCYKRWLAIRPIITKLIQLQCPRCNKQGYAIETGEEMEDYNEK